METVKYIKTKIILSLILSTIVFTGCERNLSDDVVLATFDTTGEVFTDNFVGMGSNFYLPFANSKLDAFSVDNQAGYESSASYRVDVPNANDPTGNYAGAILRIDGVGRDLSGYDALTFYAKASQGINLSEVGFGQDFITNSFLVSTVNLSVGTSWAKYTIPIPDASKLVEERGVFWYADGTDETGGLGYTLWFDEIRFEKLGTVAQQRPFIYQGQDVIVESFIGATTSIEGIGQVSNFANGQDININAAPSYFTFNSSDPSVATVDTTGQISIIAEGTTTITATLNGIEAQGSLTLVSLGAFTPAPTPDRDPLSVISLFSNTYENVPVDFYNGYYAPYQTTTSNDFVVDGDDILNYENFNFVGIEFNQNVPTINGKLATHLHLDIFVPGSIPVNADMRVALVDFGGDASFGGGDDTDIFADFSLGATADQWISIDMDISGLNLKTNLGQIILSGDGPGTPPANFYVDNMYFYRADGQDITPQVVNMPIDFELSNPANYVFLGFEGADSAIEANPDQSGINTSANVMRTTKTSGAQFYGGTFIDVDNPIDFSLSEQLKVKVWSPKLGIPVRLAVENSGGGVPQQFVDVNTTTTDQWEELTFDFSGLTDPSLEYNRIVIFMEFIPGLFGDGTTYYFDDIQLGN